MLTNQQIESLIESLSLDEMIGQMLCFQYIQSEPERMREWAEKTHTGSFFVTHVNPEHITAATELVKTTSKLPPIIAADIEAGPGFAIWGEELIPHEMAWGACNNADMVEKVHEEIAKRCRSLGIHWSFSPVVDINYNKDNPVTNIRAIGDSPKRVARLGAAAIRGYQKNGYMIAGCKHFPGDGLDDRNQHFCTTVNPLSKDEWMEAYGYVYKEMFKANTASVMVAHITLPAFDEPINEWLGFPPASLSYNMQTKLLKEELGFNGCIVSDAMSMVGACACVDADRLAIEFVKAGGDILLFALPEYFDHIKGAVESGEISIERIRDAVRRIIIMKDNARLFEDQAVVLSEINQQENIENLSKYAKDIAENSLCVVRNYENLLPVNIEPGSKILMLNIQENKTDPQNVYIRSMETLKKELENRGYEVVSYINASRADFEKDFDNSALVLINCRIDGNTYSGGTLRTGWAHIAPFWRGEILKHPKVIFTSFGDPYKLYEFPYLKTYINAFSYSEPTQRAFVKALFGEIPFNGKSPVHLNGFFENQE